MTESKEITARWDALDDDQRYEMGLMLLGYVHVKEEEAGTSFLDTAWKIAESRATDDEIVKILTEWVSGVSDG